MDNIYERGDMHWCIVFFDEPENKGESKKRPIFIVERGENEVYFFRITTVKGEPHQRKYRPPLLNWRMYGFSKPSYINIEVPLLIRDINVFIKATHIAKAQKIDIQIVENRLIELGFYE
ncbi:hypothetical protein [Mammaliicoccus sp. Dog046]|uniref:hypothetical protein n=1 Tax=Mammaliicoccus sp. Dog046 TaxID=3034233 RepID=UPI002B25C874|nr:hypothetical protein [Mammaliicoccus sp. Dog046]WQK84962.1 hypothetical protein P3U32_10050 [Mammaliicoccus sp. Dog046]